MKVMAFKVWSAADQRAWRTAINDGDVFDGRGPAAHWSNGTRRSTIHGYGRWLGFLASNDPHAHDLAPIDQITRIRIAAYIRILEMENGPAGLWNYIKHLYDAVRVMDPSQDWSWLKAVERQLARKVQPRRKRHRMVDSTVLYGLGHRLMDEASAMPVDVDAALRFRDGLMIALLAVIPLRRRNLAMIRIGRHLVVEGERYLLVFRAEETKNRQPIDFEVPDKLAPFIKRYLAIRRHIPGARDHSGLWASAKGCPLTDSGIYDRVCHHTRDAFGFAVNLHLFRACATSTIAMRDPEQVLVARDLLGHSSFRTTERFYIQARQIDAGRRYHDILQNDRLRVAGTSTKGGN